MLDRLVNADPETVIFVLEGAALVLLIVLLLRQLGEKRADG